MKFWKYFSNIETSNGFALNINVECYDIFKQYVFFLSLKLQNFVLLIPYYQMRYTASTGVDFNIKGKTTKMAVDIVAKCLNCMQMDHFLIVYIFTGEKKN